jgi:hypothetical protein
VNRLAYNLSLQLSPKRPLGAVNAAWQFHAVLCWCGGATELYVMSPKKANGSKGQALSGCLECARGIAIVRVVANVPGRIAILLSLLIWKTL